MSEEKFGPFDVTVDADEYRKVLLRWWEQRDYLKFYLPKPDTAMLARIYGPDPADWPLYNEDSKKRLAERAARAYDEARTKALLEDPPRYLSGTLMPSLPGRRSAVMSPSEMMLALVRDGAVSEERKQGSRSDC